VHLFSRCGEQRHAAQLRPRRAARRLGGARRAGGRTSAWRAAACPAQVVLAPPARAPASRAHGAQQQTSVEKALRVLAAATAAANVQWLKPSQRRRQ
jgi:hypothetical protein